MQILYFDSTRDDWACGDANSEQLARSLISNDVHTSNSMVVELVRVLVAEDVLDPSKIQIRFIKTPTKVQNILLDDYGNVIGEWPVGFLEEVDFVRLANAQHIKRIKKHKKMLEELERDYPLLEMVSRAFWESPEKKIETIKKVRMRLPELGIKEAKDFVDNIWLRLSKENDRY